MSTYRAAALAALFTLGLQLHVFADPAQTASGLRDGQMTAAEAAAAWSDAGVDPLEALESLEEMPLAPGGDPAGQEIEITAVDGRTSTALIVVPSDGPQRDGTYRVVVLLHGLGGDQDQAIKGAQGLMPPHTILVAPSALRSNGNEAFEDLQTSQRLGLPVAEVFPTWFSYGQSALPLQALDYVRSHYPVDPNRVILAGYSMGGFGT
ncbi:hypothetical protein OAX78_04170, partial [Planctomycetota bacterium]|nr:hypothetical protein [Planctomycetota bacterium]